MIIYVQAEQELINLVTSNISVENLASKSEQEIAQRLMYMHAQMEKDAILKNDKDVLNVLRKINIYNIASNIVENRKKPAK